MRHLARYLLIGLLVAAIVLLLGFTYFPQGEALRYLGARIG